MVPHSLCDRVMKVTVGILSGAFKGRALAEHRSWDNLDFECSVLTLIRPYALLFGSEICHHKLKGLTFSRVLCFLAYIRSGMGVNLENVWR